VSPPPPPVEEIGFVTATLLYIVLANVTSNPEF
jgi:hypothetical protein